MGQPRSSTENAAIIGLIVAIYGAVLSTANSIIQFMSHRRDRADVVLKIRTNMSTNDRRYAGMKLTLVTATNRGHRPVTIHGFSTKLLDSNDEYMLMDVRPPTPHEITEGQTMTAFINEAQYGRRFIESYYVWDSVGRHFRICVAPWHRRIVSRIRRKLAPISRVETKKV